MSNKVEGQTAISAWTIDQAHSSVEFAVKHMVITTVRGRFSKFDIALKFDEQHPLQSSVEAKIEAASIDTREAKRDEHLRSADFLESQKFPYIVFKSKRIEDAGGGNYRIVGDLTIREATREVVLDTTFSGFAKNPWGVTVAGFNATATLNRTDWNLTWNHALETGGVLVGEEVKVSVEIEATRQG